MVSMFGWCCAQSKDGSTVHFKDPSLEEGTSAFAMAPQSQMSQQQQQQFLQFQQMQQQQQLQQQQLQQTPPVVPSMPAATPAAGRPPAPEPFTAPSTTVDEMNKKKECLQDMVKEFAKQVVHGQPCEVVNNKGSVSYASYSIDKALKVLTVTPTDGSAGTTVQLSQIADVTRDGASLPTLYIVACSQPMGADRFVCLQCPNNAGQNIGLLLSNTHERERFITCMKILKWAIGGNNN